MKVRDKGLSILAAAAVLAFGGSAAFAKDVAVRDPAAVVVVPDRGGPTHVQVPPGTPTPHGMMQDTPDQIQRGRRAEAEASADSLGTEDAVTTVRQAERAARAGNLRLANELAERVETRLLTGTTIAGAERMPATGGVIGRLQEGRAALARRDQGQAAMLFAEAAGLLRAVGR